MRAVNRQPGFRAGGLLRRSARIRRDIPKENSTLSFLRPLLLLFDTVSSDYAPYSPEITLYTKNVERANNSREWGPFSKPWPCSISGYRIFLDLSLSESETACLNLYFGCFSQKSDHRRARYHHFCEIFLTDPPTNFGEICLPIVL